MYFTFDGQNDFDRQATGGVAGRTGAADGAIVGCRWAQGRFEGKGVLEFRSTSDRVRVRVDGGFRVHVAVREPPGGRVRPAV